jgi:hypothetical protein
VANAYLEQMDRWPITDGCLYWAMKLIPNAQSQFSACNHAFLHTMEVASRSLSVVASHVTMASNGHVQLVRCTANLEKNACIGLVMALQLYTNPYLQVDPAHEIIES